MGHRGDFVPGRALQDPAGFQSLKRGFTVFSGFALVRAILPVGNARFIPFNFVNMLKISDFDLEIKVDDLKTLFHLSDFILLLISSFGVICHSAIDKIDFALDSRAILALSMVSH